MRTETDRRVHVAGAQPEPDERRASSTVPVVVSVIAGLLVVGLMAAIMLTPRAGTTAAGGAAPPAATEKLAVGYLAPNFTLTRADGGQVQMSSYRGVKPVWVNVWTTWCPPCRAEMPQMQKIYAKYQSQGLEILGVDFKESQDQVKQFVSSNGYTWNFLLDFDGNVGIIYHANAIPTHVFVGRDGVIKRMHIGGGWQPNEMEQSVQALLAPN